ncbi:MAG: membrane protein insertase YidC [Lentimicrobiaceae bacterium]|nr:membrane protein insertase YidC [Lentimicrobiaceae bacterium]
MNKHTIIGLILLLGLFIGYSIYMRPSEEQLAARKQYEDSLKKQHEDSLFFERMAQMMQDSAEQANSTASQSVEEKTAVGTENATQAQEQQATENYGSFSLAAKNQQAASIVVENDLYQIRIGSKGGKIESVMLKNVQTHDSLPVVLFDADVSETVFGFSFTNNYLVFSTNDLYFHSAAQNDTVRVKGKDSVQIAMRLYPNKTEEEFDTASYVEFLYTVRGNDYRTGLSVSFFNLDNYIDRNQPTSTLTWQTDLFQQEKNVKNEMTASTIFYSDINEVNNLKESPDKSDSIDYSTRLKWVSFKQHFFTSTLIADDYFEYAKMVVNVPQYPEGKILKNMKAELVIPLKEKNQTFGLQFYFGPNKYRTLKQYKINLESQIQLGGKLISWINKWIVLPVFNSLESRGWSYGVIILILTILLKTVLFPLAYSNYISSAKMRVMKPEIEEIAKKFPNQEDAMKKQQATMAFYRQVGIKPMAGCLPMLLQMPILFAMFRFFPSAYELRQQPFLWAKDLSSYDSVFSWDAHIPIISSFYGNHISLFCLLMTIATLGYTILNNKLMMSPAGGNAQQMKMMKWMMYLMPIMFLGIFNSFSSGLSYYYLLVNLITFAQMGIFRLIVNDGKLRSKLQANKAKPVTKSKWQKRIEEMTRQQQAMAAQRNSSGLPQTKQRSNTSVHNKKKR